MYAMDDRSYQCLIAWIPGGCGGHGTADDGRRFGEISAMSLPELEEHLPWSLAGEISATCWSSGVVTSSFGEISARVRS